MRTTRRRRWPWLLVLSSLGGCGGPASEAPTPATTAGAPPGFVTGSIEAAVAGPQRSEANRARDVYRHPVATLDFFGLRPDMNVVEIWPGQGWYTEILAPVLRDRGQLTVALTDPAAGGHRGQMARDFLERQKREPWLLDRVRTTVLAPPAHVDLGPAGSADLVLTFRNTHNWVQDGVAEACFAAMYRVLRPGGTLGLVQHREKPGAPAVTDRRRGYLPEEYVIGLAEGAGFVLDGRSEINANPADTKDYPDSVWSLPPTLRGGDRDRDRYLAIGESDRMTLRFHKPDH